MAKHTQMALVVVDPRIPNALVIEEFWSHVDRSGDCWLWHGPMTSDGYGRFRDMKAHRFAFLVTNGTLTDGLILHHTCNTRLCVRPAHLVQMSQAEHVAITPGTYVGQWLGHELPTHCAAGHELSGDNLLPSGLKRGYRQCRICRNAQSAAWRAANPEKFRAAVASYKERHADEIRAKGRAYHARKRANTQHHDGA